MIFVTCMNTVYNFAYLSTLHHIRPDIESSVLEQTVRKSVRNTILYLKKCKKQKFSVGQEVLFKNKLDWSL